MERSKVFTAVMVAALIFLSVALMTAIVAENGLPGNDRWSVSLDSPSGTFNSYAPRFVDDNDNLYVASGKMIYCLAPDGIRWSMTPPDPEGIGTYYESWNLASAASGSDRSYLLIYPGSADLPGFPPSSSLSGKMADRSGPKYWIPPYTRRLHQGLIECISMTITSRQPSTVTAT